MVAKRGIGREDMQALLRGVPKIEASIREWLAEGGIEPDDFDSWIHSGLGSMAINARSIADYADSIRKMALGQEPMDSEAIDKLGSQVLTVLALFFIVRSECRRANLH